MKFTSIATPLFATSLVSVSILGDAPHAQALPIKFVYADTAQGETTTGLINLTVPRGYDLVLSFMKVGETVTAVRLGDPSRIAFGSDGVLCPSNSSKEGEHSCSATGANVIFFRQIQDALGKGIPFPYLTSSADGSTQATIFTNGPKGQRMYPVLLNLGGSEPPSYTTVAIKPEEDKPHPQKVALSVRPGDEKSTSLSPDAEPREFSQPLGNKIQPPFVIPSDPTLKAPDSTKIAVSRSNSRIMETPLEPLRSSASSLTETPTDNLKQDDANFFSPHDSDTLFSRQDDSSSTPPLIDAPTDNNLLTKSTKGSLQSIDDATAVAFGLLVAIQKGRIEPQTKLWDQAQNAIILLRRGASRIEAIRNAGLDTSVFNLLVLWGQTSSFVQEQATSINSVAEIKQQNERQSLLDCLQSYESYSANDCKLIN